jgi:hypothetical protein
VGGFPVCCVGYFCVVGDVEGDVCGAVFWVAFDVDGVAGVFLAEGGEFLEGGGGVGAAADVEALAVEVLYVVELVEDEGEEVVDVEYVSDLFSLSAVSDPGEGLVEDVSCCPEYGDALVNFTHLLVCELEACVCFLEGEFVEGFHGVDAACGEEEGGGVVASCDFEAFDGAGEVCVDDVCG